VCVCRACLISLVTTAAAAAAASIHFLSTAALDQYIPCFKQLLPAYLELVHQQKGSKATCWKHFSANARHLQVRIAGFLPAQAVTGLSAVLRYWFSRATIPLCSKVKFLLRVRQTWLLHPPACRNAAGEQAHA
jgi:hypothetical protein